LADKLKKNISKITTDIITNNNENKKFGRQMTKHLAQILSSEDKENYNRNQGI